MHLRNGLSVASIRALMCLNNWSPLGLIHDSDMLTVLSAQQLFHEVRTGQLTVLPFEMPGMERNIGVTTRRGAHLAPGARALLAALARREENFRKEDGMGSGARVE